MGEGSVGVRRGGSRWARSSASEPTKQGQLDAFFERLRETWKVDLTCDERERVERRGVVEHESEVDEVGEENDDHRVSRDEDRPFSVGTKRTDKRGNRVSSLSHCSATEALPAKEDQERQAHRFGYHSTAQLSKILPGTKAQTRKMIPAACTVTNHSRSALELDRKIKDEGREGEGTNRSSHSHEETVRFLCVWMARRLCFWRPRRDGGGWRER